MDLYREILDGYMQELKTDVISDADYKLYGSNDDVRELIKIFKKVIKKRCVFIKRLKYKTFISDKTNSM